MLSRLLVIPSIALFCSAECVRVTPLEYGRLEVFAFTSLGDRISPTGIALLEVGSRKIFKSTFHGVSAKIPYGEYLARIQAPGFRTVERTIRVYQAEAALRVELPVSVECGGYSMVHGLIKHAPRNHQLWIKVVPARGTGGAEAPVGQQGDFLVAGLDGGIYLLAVLDGTSIVYTQTVDVFGDKALALDLGQR